MNNDLIQKAQQLLQGYNPYNFDPNAPINKVPLLGKYRQTIQPYLNPQKQTPMQYLQQDPTQVALNMLAPVGSIQTAASKVAGKIPRNVLSDLENFYMKAIVNKQTPVQNPSIYQYTQDYIEKYFPEYATASNKTLGKLIEKVMDIRRNLPQERIKIAREFAARKRK